jgi:hypothetical protein
MDLRTKEERVNDYIRENMTSKLFDAVYGDTTVYSETYFLTIKGVRYSVRVDEQFESEEKEIEYVINEFKNEICSRLIWL